MSELFKVSVKAIDKDARAATLQVEATNNPDQNIPTGSMFYLTVLASMYWFAKERSRMAPTSAQGDEKTLPRQRPLAPVPLFERYIACCDSRSKRTYKKLFAELAATELGVEVASEKRGRNRCKTAVVNIWSMDPQLLGFLTPKLTLHTIFGPQGFDDMKYYCTK